MVRFVVLAPLWLAACRVIDTDGDGVGWRRDCDDGDAAVGVASAWYLDADGDGHGVDGDSVADCLQPAGYAALAGDCDDGEPSIHPSADEVCDGLDNDCDGRSDEGLETGPRFFDADGDGFGDPGQSESLCGPLYGYVDDGGDCDDQDLSIHPGAAETCDGLDQDCDNEIDEGVLLSCYGDLDGDGWGTDDRLTQSCNCPPGTVELGGDCDEANPDVHPGMDETWYDGVDSDCDGASDFDADGDGGISDDYGGDDCDDGDPLISADATERCDSDDVDEDCDGVADDLDPDATETATVYPDLDGDGYGDPDAAAEYCDPPSDLVDEAGDCDDGDPDIHPGADETWYDGVDGDCDGGDDDDADGDGYAADDREGGDCDDGDAEVSPASVERCDNGIDDDCDGVTDPALSWGAFGTSCADVVLEGVTVLDRAGGAVAGAGDTDGDGLADVVVGADNVRSGTEDVGAAYLVLGEGGLASGSLADADATFLGEGRSERLGYHLAGAGDTDADGFDDVLLAVCTAGVAVVNGPVSSMSIGSADAFLDVAIGGWSGSLAGAGDVDGDGYADVLVGESSDGSYRGVATLFLGPLGDATETDADAVFTGVHGSERAGFSVGGAGDTNGDGLDDILIGATGGSGAAYLVPGPVDEDDLDLAAWKLEGVSSGDLAGWSVAGAGDTDDDGYADILVGAIQESSLVTWGGAVYVVLGGFDVEAGTSTSLADADATVVGERYHGYLGSSVAGVGDVDGDGHDDILLGEDNSAPAASGGGAAYLFLGPVTSGVAADADLVLAGDDASEHAGSSVAGPGDVDGDGYTDLVIGAPRADAGQAYLVWGGF